MKRIFALLLALVLVSMVLISCGKEPIDEAKDYVNNNQLTPQEPYITLNMIIPCDTVPSANLVEAMQLEFNSVTEAKYRTRVLFEFVPSADYVDYVMNKSQDCADVYEEEEFEDTTSVTLNDPYPIKASYQCDIFVTTSKSMLQELADKEQLTDLTSYMTSTYNRNLCNLSAENSIYHTIYDNGFIHTTITNEDETTTEKDVFYGVPSNFKIGMYTYYVIEKTFADKYYFSQDKSIPIATRIQTLSNKPEYAASVQTVEGDYRTRYNYDSNTYYVEVRETPILNTSDIFNAMFCVGKNCVNVDRAMKVIVELFTNSTLHTTLQYGAKNVTYRLTTDSDNNQIVELIPTFDPSDTNNENPIYPYQMNMLYTGNIMNIIPCPEKGYDVEFAKYTYIQNSESTYTAN